MSSFFSIRTLVLAGGLAVALASAGIAQSAPPTASQNAPAATRPVATSQNPPAATQPAGTSGSQPAAASTANPPALDTPPTDDAQSQDAAKQKDKEYKHDGGKNDIEAIGNRKIGGRGLGDWYSLEHEIGVGKAYAQQIEQSMKLVQDPVVNEYVNRIGQNLVRNSDAKVPFTIKVVDDDSINAFALPGGFFYVNSGLILAADEEAEMAGVMAHEIAHVAARHAMRQMTRAQWANFASIPLIFIGGGAGYAARMAANLLVPTTFMKFSRGFEAEADYLGLEYMYKAGYDPQAFISFFEKVEATEKKKPGAMSKLFASHPQTPDRVTTSEKEIATVLPPREEYIVNTSEFDEVKARLAGIENRRKMLDMKDNRPSLRRTTADNTNSTDKNTKDDDRPTLKRRDDQN